MNNDGDMTADDVRAACISAKTQEGYRGGLRTIVKWIHNTKSTILRLMGGSILCILRHLTLRTFFYIVAMMSPSAPSTDIAALSRICTGDQTYHYQMNTKTAW
jgi:hypothetical protein